MTMYYYGGDFNNSAGGDSGHWPYNYTEADKVHTCSMSRGRLVTCEMGRDRA